MQEEAGFEIHWRSTQQQRSLLSSAGLDFKAVVEVGVFAVEAPRAPVLCGSPATNCQVVRYNEGAYIGSRVILSTPLVPASSGIVSHELGHAFGLWHIDPARAGFDSALSVMGNPAVGRWTDIDIDAFRLVYSAGLSPADPRQRFVSAGLIH